jgi:hypothetical protein
VDCKAQIKATTFVSTIRSFVKGEKKKTGLKWDEVVLSKTVLSNFRPKQVNEWIGGPRASLFQLCIALLT